MKNKYSYNKQIVDVEIYFREVNGKIQNVEIEEYLKLKDEEKAGISVEKLSILKPWWALSSKVERMSTNPITQTLENISYVKNQTWYYLKSCSIAILEFERDGEGDERIKNIDHLVGQNGLDPIVIMRIVREILKVINS